MKVSIVKKDQIITENGLDESTVIDKRDYTSIVLLSKVIVASIYAFGLGYSLFFLGDEFIEVGLLFLALLIISYIIIEYPYALLKALFLPKVFDKDNINLQIHPFTMSIDICSKIAISKTRIILSLIVPFIILAIIPTIASYLLEFNMYFYVIASSAAIIATKDLIYLFLILKNSSKIDNIKLALNEFIFYN
ncbi:metalloprotease family protein [Clostridium sp. AL.422]|uniref:metalloprotease family protein n=1 Tax=Clostridium TaxID=1485 RepID=UPI00293DB52C|nr:MULTISPECIES: metalloprotease family protein [unclassified Clostridium]MDV4151630.1 metalloprotease family protein [Clostridium sp. AL.422]